MNRRKIENWVIFGLKLLPFLMLILFAVYIHRHDLEPITVSEPTYTDYVLDVGGSLAPGSVLIPTNNDTSQIFEYSASNGFFAYNVGLAGGFYYDGMPGWSDLWSLSDDRQVLTYIGTSDLAISSKSGDGSATVTSLVDAEVTITEPLLIISYSFNNFLDRNINLEIFNIDDFYDWTVNSWFNGNAPVFYKPVFLILVYELIIDLLILLYSFITFVIKFAEKWLNGIYNKEW